MLNWLSANWASLVTGLAVAAVVAAIIVKMMRDKRNNKGGCACGCEGCPSAGLCRKG